MISRKTRLDALKVYLRFPRHSDFASWSQIRNRDREHLMPWEPQWYADANSKREWRARYRSWKEAWQRGSGYTFLIFDKQTDLLLGGIALTNIRLGSARTGTLGYWLSSGAQGHGYMSEAVERLCEFGEGVLGLARIEAATVVSNERSQAVLKRCGFEREGVAKAYLQIAGTRQDHVLFGRTSMSFSEIG